MTTCCCAVLSCTAPLYPWTRQVDHQCNERELDQNISCTLDGWLDYYGEVWVGCVWFAPAVCDFSALRRSPPPVAHHTYAQTRSRAASRPRRRASRSAGPTRAARRSRTASSRRCSRTCRTAPTAAPTTTRPPRPSRSTSSRTTPRRDGRNVMWRNITHCNAMQCTLVSCNAV